MALLYLFIFFILSGDYATTLHSFVNETPAATEEMSLYGHHCLTDCFVLLQGWTPG